ncbi:MAG TPA: M57 family metalloprotease, partial [Coleofasciculaceae cyanobacterium]
GYGSSMKDYTLNTNFKAQGSDDRKFSIQFNYKDGLNSVSSAAQTALKAAASVWENVIPYSSFNGAHTLNIDVVGINSSQDWLAAATNTGGQTAANGKWLPTTGTIRINTSYGNTYNNNPEYLKEIVTHELGHVLGLGTIWEKNGNSLIDRSTNTYKADSYAGRAYGEVTGTLQPTAIPLEAGSYGHWDENKLQDELMTPYAESIGSQMPLSEITIASLRDLGWNVNYGAAEKFSLG